jgi:predicted phage baseplate assembly protein
VSRECDCGGTGTGHRPIENAPGLPELVYRVGTHSSFVDALRRTISATPALRSLTTRELDDPSMALLDGAASLLDVLTFYSERIANEGYLRTSTELGSVRALAAEIGYQLAPGVAASTHLAFTMDDVPGGPESAIVHVGTRAQSVPGQDETPQVFETIEDVEVRPGWNVLAPRLTEPEVLRFHLDVIRLRGTSTGLSVGDHVLFVGDERAKDPTSDRWDLRRVREIEERPDVEPDRGVTIVVLDSGLGSIAPQSAPPSRNVKIFALRERAALFGHNAMPWTDLPLPLRVGELDPQNNDKFIPGPYKDRQRTWADARLPIDSTELDLERVVPGILPGSWIVLTAPGKTPEKADAEIFYVVGVTEHTVADFLLTAKVTALTVRGEHISYFRRRTATVLCVSEELAFAERPITADVSGNRIDLGEPANLPPGRTVIATGGSTKSMDEVAEVAVVDSMSGSSVLLREPLAHTYRRDSFALLANVAPATHGETRTRVQPEVLGSGDARQPFQSFALLGAPLTYTGTTSGTGAVSSLVIRVDGIAWHEVPTLYGQAADAHVYVLRPDETGTVVVSFGDGLTGARLPTGTNNVTAEYRVGIGLGAILDPGRISLLLDRPLGVTEVVNPVAALGAADPELLDDARRNAPSTVVTLGRVVSLADYEAYARAFAGVGKASAVALWHATPGQPLSAGEQRVVHVTVATAAGAPLGAKDPLHDQLRGALNAARHPSRPVLFDGFDPLTFSVEVAVRIDPDRVADTVIADIRQRLTAAFSFSARDFAQDVTAAEVLAVVHRTPGVLGASLDGLRLKGRGPGIRDRIEARPARVENGIFVRAQLLTVGAIEVREATS